MIKNITLTVSLVMLLTLLNGQQIILDLPVRAGELTLFPEVGNQNNYYYLADKAKLATGADGQPQFSFLRYVENQHSANDGTTLREGLGGGIVHAVVSLHVTDDQLRTAERALRRINQEGKIVGPIVYTSGRFGLVSSFKEEDGTFAKKVVGLGAAPILDGQKAAISIQLTKLGAKILWESFKTSTPDISFTFEMDVKGFRLPKRAKIEADFDQIYDHKAFDAGLSTPYLAAEIKLAFDDLLKSGAIKVEQIGSDESMNSLISTAYNKLTEMMFAPLGGSGTPSLSQLTQNASNHQSVLDRATRLRNTDANSNHRNGSGDIFNKNIDQQWCSHHIDRRYFNAPSQLSYNEYTSYWDDEHFIRLDTVPEQDSTQVDTMRREDSPPANDVVHEDGAPPRDVPTSDTTDISDNRATPRNRSTPNASNGGMNFAVVATFEMKRVKQSGKFVIDLNKWTQDVITMRFDHNIGNLSAYIEDDRHFYQVNLDDPLYKQREIFVLLDGSNANDFGEFINYVSIKLKKTYRFCLFTMDEALMIK